MGDEFDALGFAAAERRTGLAQLQITEAGIAEGLERTFDARHTGEEIHRFLDGEFQHLRNVFAAVFNIERFAIEPATAADFARHKCRRQEIHLQFDRAGAFAFRAAALRAVEGKAAGRISAQARFGHLREKLADVIEKADVGRGDRTRCAANRRLVHFVNGLGCDS